MSGQAMPSPVTEPGPATLTVSARVGTKCAVRSAESTPETVHVASALLSHGAPDQ